MTLLQKTHLITWKGEKAAVYLHQLQSELLIIDDRGCTAPHKASPYDHTRRGEGSTKQVPHFQTQSGYEAAPWHTLFCWCCSSPACQLRHRHVHQKHLQGPQTKYWSAAAKLRHEYGSGPNTACLLNMGRAHSPSHSQNLAECQAERWLILPGVKPRITSSLKRKAALKLTEKPVG